MLPCLLLALFLPSTPAPLQLSNTPAKPGDLLVSSRDTDQILRYDGRDGSFVGVFAEHPRLQNPVGLSFGPDGQLYVSSADNDKILRFDGITGEFVDTFVRRRVDAPRQLNFGPDGDLYVGNAGTDEVLRFDGATGAFVEVFAASPELDGPTSFTFGPEGRLWVGSVLTNTILVFDGKTGEHLSTLSDPTLVAPHDVAFGPDGLLYVTNAFSNNVARFDPRSGAALGIFVDDARLSVPLGLQWEADGSLLVTNQGRNDVRRYDGETGALLERFVRANAGGLSSPLFSVRMPRRMFGLTSFSPGLAGRSNRLALGGAQPGRAVWFVGSGLPGTAAVSGCPDLQLDLKFPRILGIAIADEAGNAVVSVPVASELEGAFVLLQALEPESCLHAPEEAFPFPYFGSDRRPFPAPPPMDRR